MRQEWRGASLVAQRWRVCAWTPETPPAEERLSPRASPWACALGSSTAAEPLRGEARAPQLQRSPCPPRLEGPRGSEGPAQPGMGLEYQSLSWRRGGKFKQTNRRRRQRDLTGCPGEGFALHCQGPRLDPWSGHWDLLASQHSQKEKEGETETPRTKKTKRTCH